MKDCPTAEQIVNFTIFERISGLAIKNVMPELICPKAPAMTVAVKHMKRLVQNMKSYGLGLTPALAVSVFRRFWKPAVTPSKTSDTKEQR